MPIVNAPVAVAVIVIAALPSKLTPLIARAVCKAVAVLALPVNAPVNPVDVTLVKPANVVELAPKLIAVEPIVVLLFVKLALAMLDNVLELPLIVLLVNVSVPANVANVPVVGNVTLVVAVDVNVVAKAPLVVKLPPRVIVLPLLLLYLHYQLKHQQMSLM